MDALKSPMSRFALYFTPARGTAWERFGSAWLGRSAFMDTEVPQTGIEGLPDATFRACTASPRRYGFHATLKAPFRLARDVSLEDLRGELDGYCAGLSPFQLAYPELRMLGSFMALTWTPDDERVLSIAEECVSRFDAFRAPLESAEIARRRKEGLSAIEDELLLRWGYPHVMEAFRFHFSLTGPLHELAAASVRRIEQGAHAELSKLAEEPMMFDAISIFEETSPGTNLRVIHRASFGVRRGRLIYVMGASGSGKDSILEFARAKLSTDSKVRFARRTITRREDDGAEKHEAVSANEFQQREESGQFVMAWDANGCRYGVGKEILSWLANGLTVVVNGSRAYLAEAQSRFSELESVLIAATPATLASRLKSRGRESEHEIAQRMERNSWFDVPESGADCWIDNNGQLESAGNKLIAFLELEAKQAS